MNESEALQFAKDTDWAYWVGNAKVRDLLGQIRTVTVESTRAEVASAGQLAASAAAPTDDTKIKLVVVGDGAVGKTCLLVVFSRNMFPEDYVPTVFENFTHVTQCAGKEVSLHLWDTAGQEEYDRLRPLSYPATDIAVLCYSTVSRNTYQSISTKWAPEIRHYLPGMPTLLVGLKTDLRDSGQKDPHAVEFEPIPASEGEELAKKIGARYLEASSKENKGVKEVFETAISMVWHQRHPDQAPKHPAAATPAAGAPVTEKKRIRCDIL